MNKTLLLILCDFLLLNLLALTRWEKAEPPRAKLPPVPELAANAVSKDQDIVEMMRQSLADEQSTRDELARQLTATDAARSYFLEKGFSPEYGAREMGRVIQDYVKRKLADELLFGALQHGGTAEIDFADGEVLLRAHGKPPKDDAVAPPKETVDA